MSMDCMSVILWIALAAGAVIGLLEVISEYE